MTEAIHSTHSTTSVRERLSRLALTAPRSGQGLAGVLLVGTVVILGLLAPVIAPFDPTDQLEGANLLGPSTTHLFGTDQVNRDVFSRVVYGARTSVWVAVVGVSIGAALGILIGLIAVASPFADVTTQRAFDLLLAFPTLILAITLAAIFGTGTSTVILVIIAAEIPVFGRITRSSGLRTRELPFVEAAAVIGAGRWWNLRTHILPHALEPLVVQLGLSLSTAVFIESAMSFIGIGVRPPNPSLGSIISDSLPELSLNPVFALGPLIVVTLLVLGFMLIAQAIGKARRS